MSKAENKLTAVTIKAAGPGKLQDGGNLVLDKNPMVASGSTATH